MAIANCNERLTITIHGDVKKVIERAAAERYLSKSDFIIQAVMYYLKYKGGC